jgi:hypothetical protein
LPLALGLLDALPDVPGWVVADRGLASDVFRERIWNLGAVATRYEKLSCCILTPRRFSPLRTSFARRGVIRSRTLGRRRTEFPT